MCQNVYGICRLCLYGVLSLLYKGIYLFISFQLMIYCENNWTTIFHMLNYLHHEIRIYSTFNQAIIMLIVYHMYMDMAWMLSTLPSNCHMDLNIYLLIPTTQKYVANIIYLVKKSCASCFLGHSVVFLLMYTTNVNIAWHLQARSKWFSQSNVFCKWNIEISTLRPGVTYIRQYMGVIKCSRNELSPLRHLVITIPNVNPLSIVHIHGNKVQWNMD